MNREHVPHNDAQHERQPQASSERCNRELSEAELQGVSAGEGGLVHETVHAGSVTPPRTGGPGTGQAPRLPANAFRSPPTGIP